jgi:DNA-binding NtrC family response regulator
LVNTINNVLILDDENTIIENLDLFLKAEGFEIFTHANAENALESIKAGTVYSVGIIDILLPGMNGEEFILKASKLLPNMKFVIMTGSLDYKVSQPLKNIGITEENVIKKPVMKIREMITKLQSMLYSIN